MELWGCSRWFLDDEVRAGRLRRYKLGGRIKYREDIIEGLENAPEAFIGLLEGKNFGKLVVRIAS